MLKICPEYSFVLEDDIGICGYAVCAKDMDDYRKRMSSEWLKQMQNKYPDPCPSKTDDFTVIEVSTATTNGFRNE